MRRTAVVWWLWCFVLVLLGLAGCASSGPARGRPSVMTQRPGSKLADSFAVGDKLVYLPPGDWTLVAAKQRGTEYVAYGGESGPSFDLVHVAEVAAGRLNRGVRVAATEATGTGVHWLDEPCKGEEGLFRLDHRRSFRNQSCVDIRSRSSGGGARAGGVHIPSDMITVAFTRYGMSDLLVVNYDFNPEAYGFADASSAAWTPEQVRRDPRKTAFIEALKTWVAAALPWVEYGYDGESEPTTPFPPAPQPAHP